MEAKKSPIFSLPLHTTIMSKGISPRLKDLG
jgi:hypothetical protein